MKPEDHAIPDDQNVLLSSGQQHLFHSHVDGQLCQGHLHLQHTPHLHLFFLDPTHASTKNGNNKEHHVNIFFSVFISIHYHTQLCKEHIMDNEKNTRQPSSERTLIPSLQFPPPPNSATYTQHRSQGVPSISEPKVGKHNWIEKSS